MKRKMLAVLMATMMVLVVGCKLKVDWTDKEEVPVKTTMDVMDVVMPSGKLLIKDFDMITITRFLVATEEVKDYHIIINTPGGNASNIVTMINRIQHLQSKGAVITTEIIGYGYSAGALLFMAGDNRIVHEGALLMFHGAGVTAYGQRYGCQSEFPDEAPDGIKEMLCLLDQNFIDLLAEKTNMTIEEIDKWMYGSDNNFMSAQTAFDLGVATELAGIPYELYLETK